MEIVITNKNMSVVNAKKSMQFDCPNCKYNQIKAAWNYVHNYCLIVVQKLFGIQIQNQLKYFKEKRKSTMDLQTKDSLKSSLAILLAVETLEYENQNYLSGDNRSRSLVKIALIKDMINDIDENAK